MHNAYDTYLPWFILREIPLIGNALYKRLIEAMGSAQNVLTAQKEQLRQINKIGPKIIEGIYNHHVYVDSAKKELDKIFKKQYHIVTLTDPLYPSLLYNIPDPPPILTYRT